MTYRTIASSCLPMRCPLMGTFVWYLLLDRLGAPGWVWGVIGTLLACVWVAWIAAQFLNESQPLHGFGEIKTTKKERP